MILYRLMCEKEYNAVDKSTPFAWYKRCKWFTDNNQFLKRVSDGSFNNSKVMNNRYTHLVIYDVDSLDGFIRVSDNELMLYRCKSQMVKIKSVIKIGSLQRGNYDDIVELYSERIK